jgi:hypothetical protein
MVTSKSELSQYIQKARTGEHIRQFCKLKPPRPITPCAEPHSDHGILKARKPEEMAAFFKAES